MTMWSMANWYMILGMLRMPAISDNQLKFYQHHFAFLMLGMFHFPKPDWDVSGAHDGWGRKEVGPGSPWIHGGLDMRECSWFCLRIILSQVLFIVHWSMCILLELRMSFHSFLQRWPIISLTACPKFCQKLVNIYSFVKLDSWNR